MEYYEIPNSNGRVAIVQIYVDLSLEGFWKIRNRFQHICQMASLCDHFVSCCE
jgi:hypothetical protein